MRNIRCVVIPLSIDDALSVLTMAIESNVMVCLTYYSLTIINHRRDFNQLVLHHIYNLRMISYSKETDQMLDIREEGERANDHKWHDYDLFKLIMIK